VPAALGTATAGLIGAANGGYFETSWGWSALLLLWVAAIALVLGHAQRVTGAQVAVVAALSGLMLWTLASVLWAPSSGSPVREFERVLVFVSAVLAVPLIVRRSRVAALLGGLLAGITGVATYALATRLFPDRIGSVDTLAGYRLSAPLGYWNALGIFSALGILLALGLVARGGSHLARAGAAAATVILALTVYFTYSRGAVLALAIGLLVTFALDKNRLEWLGCAGLLAAPPAIAVFVASRSGPLTTAGHSLHAAAHDGQRVALVTVLLCVVTAGIGAWAPLGKVRLHRSLRRSLTAAVTAAIAIGIVAALIAVGGPAGIKDKFTAAPPTTNGHLNKRLFSFSGSYRAPLWKVAWHEYEAHPILGGGAGSYETYYLQHRVRPDKVKNAHNLYLETLAELGPIGLALLLVALLTPLYAAVKARKHPLVPALAGAYVAFLAHMAVDWDWQVTAVALTGLFCGAGILVAARSEEEEQRDTSPRLRYGLLGTTLVVMVAAFIGLVGNMSLAQASTAAGNGNWAASARDARRAHTWAPWSSEPYRLLGEAQLGTGDTKGAIASFNHALGKSPDDWNVWFDMARATTGRPQAQALAHAAQLDPLGPEIAELRREIAAEKVINVVPNSPK